MTAVPPNVRSLCVVRNPALRQTLRRTLSAAGSAVEFRDSLDAGAATGQPRVLFIDTESRRAAAPEALMQIVGEGGRVVILGESLEDNELVAQLRDESLDHLISDSTVADESELMTTSVKLLTGDIFGLDKYLSWGATVHQVAIATYDDKRAAIARVSAFAEAIGTRRQVAAKIEGATDELLMNALYDAPAAGRGAEARSSGDLALEAGHGPLDASGACAQLRFGSDGRHFAVSVLDTYGALHKNAVLDSVLRARRERRPRAGSAGGAGLGLYFVLSSATRFIANIEPGRRTEVVCLFDLRQSGREAASCARSLHIFTTDRQAA